jgi:hypothetical protein
MPEFTLDQRQVPASMRRAPERPALTRQAELFENWEKLGLPSLFDPAAPKGDNHGDDKK